MNHSIQSSRLDLLLREGEVVRLFKCQRGDASRHDDVYVIRLDSPCSLDEIESIMNEFLKEEIFVIESASGLSDDIFSFKIEIRLFGSQDEKLSWEKDRQALREKDHRSKGRDMDLFFLDPKSPGSVFWRPKGWAMMEKLKSFSRMLNELSLCEEIQSPDIMDKSLWEISGHWEAYSQNMFEVSCEGRGMALKPMNCPGHAMVFLHGPRHESHLPVRLCEFGKVHRFEPSGALHGLMRLRSFTQDDSHVFCKSNQVFDEVSRMHEIAMKAYRALGFDDIVVRLSLRPEKSLGEDREWKMAESALVDVLSSHGESPEILPGEGAFYGPKIEYGIKDAKGRIWQCGTIQLDFQLPRRFDLSFAKDGGEREHVVLIHRAYLGSLERFMAILMEHFCDHIPLWLLPKDICILPVDEEFLPYAQDYARHLKKRGLKGEVISSQKPLGARSLEAKKQGYGVVVVVGRKEQESLSVAVKSIHAKKPAIMMWDESVKEIGAMLSKPLSDE